MRCDICDTIDIYKKYEIFETDHWVLLLRNDDQAYLGRGIARLKRHCGDIAELNESEWRDLLQLIKRYEAIIRKKFGASLFNWTCLMNDAFKVTPANPHVHFHVRPRYKGKVEFAGVIFEDKEFGHHYDNKKKFEPPQDVLEKILMAIKN